MGEGVCYRLIGNEFRDDRSWLFVMYYKKIYNFVKEIVEKEFCKVDGVVRVLICLIVFSMGINIKEVYLDLYFGLFGDLNDYLLEIGCIGRDFF